MQTVRRFYRCYRALWGSLSHLRAPALFAARLHVAWVFFASGLTKLRDWETTLMLFQEEYHVPLLSPGFAAWAGTAAELVFPVALALGVVTEVSALGLLTVNAVAVLSLAEIAPAALGQHYLWGVLLLALQLWGPGRWSVDAQLAKAMDLDPEVLARPTL